MGCWKDENKQKMRPGLAHFKKYKNLLMTGFETEDIWYQKWPLYQLNHKLLPQVGTFGRAVNSNTYL